MKLNREDKHELRGKIEEELKNVPTGQKVHLGKEILEELLFYKVKIDDNTIAKLPIWSGKFLRKLDLSEVNFDDVSWSYLLQNYRGWDLEDLSEKIDDALDSDEFIHIKGEDGRDYVNIPTNFSHTNANIDLTKSYEAKNYGKICIFGCDFSGVDFSRLDLNGINKLIIQVSDISNTGLAIPNDIFLDVSSANLKGIDLSSRELVFGFEDGVLELEHEGDNIYLELSDWEDFELCDFTDTGIHIKLEYNNNSKLYSDDVREIFKNVVGCYVNGKLIKTPEQRKEIASSKKIEYDKMKDEIFGSITDSIEEQVHHMKR